MQDIEVEIRETSQYVRKWQMLDKIVRKGWIGVPSKTCEVKEAVLEPRPI